jgi:vacuolar protein sorting-associated protein 52
VHQTFVRSVLEPPPATVPLLTMIRLTEDVIAEIQKRQCSPMESFVFTIRLQMWPVFQKAMADHIEALRKLAQGSSMGFFSRNSAMTNASVTNVLLILSIPCIL